MDINEVFTKPYLTEQEVALITGLAVSTLRNQRHKRCGIPYLKIGSKSIRYTNMDVKSHMEMRRICFE
jgi:hypothetical protein